MDVDVDLDQLREQLGDGSAVREDVPSGRIHIDRSLPFLLVHRRPVETADAGTDELVVSEAAYVLATGDHGFHERLGEIITTVNSAQVAAFGASLLLELWADDRPGPSPSDTGLVFHIVAPRHNAPAAVLEELETALLNIELDARPVSVVLDYRDEGWAPPGLLPLRVPAGCCHLGVGVPPVYRDETTGVVFPFELRAVRGELGRALRRAFHIFAHHSTPFRPAHFHELGRQAITPQVFETDRQISAIAASFDLLLHVTPVNAGAAEEEFRESGFARSPEFLYRSRTSDPDLMKRRLYNIGIEHIEDPALAHIFLEKRLELDRQFTLVSDRNTERFLLGSRALYPAPDAELSTLARRILEDVDPDEELGAMVAADEFAAAAEAELACYRSQDPELRSQVQIRDDIPGVMVSRGNLLVGATAKVAEDRVEALLAHEVGTHVLTHHNGAQQPFGELHAGMAGYEPLQEGLAVLWEFLVGGLRPSRVRLLAGRVIAVSAVCDGSDFADTFHLLRREWAFSPGDAFNIALRVHRGGGFTKDAIYLRGLVTVFDYLASGEPIERLHLGKISPDHLAVIEELEWRQVLEPPRLLPRFLERDDVVDRLTRVRNGLTISDALEAV